MLLPVMRLHGNRNPQEGYGAEQIGSGSDNEIWSFSDEAYEISKKYIFLRERLRDYIRVQMKKAHEDGTPVMRPVFYDFPTDPGKLECGGCLSVRTGSLCCTCDGGST